MFDLELVFMTLFTLETNVLLQDTIYKFDALYASLYIPSTLQPQLSGVS